MLLRACMYLNVSEIVAITCSIETQKVRTVLAIKGLLTSTQHIHTHTR